MPKKLTSTILLFVTFAGLLWWGIAMLATPTNDSEMVIFAVLILGCAGYALVSLLLLPRKNEL